MKLRSIQDCHSEVQEIGLQESRCYISDHCEKGAEIDEVSLRSAVSYFDWAVDCVISELLSLLNTLSLAEQKWVNVRHSSVLTMISIRFIIKDGLRLWELQEVKPTVGPIFRLKTLHLWSESKWFLIKDLLFTPYFCQVDCREYLWFWILSNF